MAYGLIHEVWVLDRLGVDFHDLAADRSFDREEASSDSTRPIRFLALRMSPRSGSSNEVISPIWSWR